MVFLHLVHSIGNPHWDHLIPIRFLPSAEVVVGVLLSIGLHVTLLEVSSESVHILIVWQDGVGLSAVEIAVPNAQ